MAAKHSELRPEVSVRADRTILVDGEPFFPIGLYYAEDEISDPTGDALCKLREMGFNTVFFNGGVDSEDQLNRIHRAGLHVWYRPPGELSGDFESLRQVVSMFARHPAILFWEMGDEPVLNQLRFADVEIGCQIVRSIDPCHPILCNQWLSSFQQAAEMKRWARLADVYGFSSYPIPLWRWGNRMSLVDDGWPHSIAVVGKQTDLWKCYAPGKPIIPVMQAWAWNCLEDGEAGYPTYEQCRFAAYQALIHGANGLHHYGVAQANRPYISCGIPPNLNEDLEQMHADFLKAQQYNQWFWSYYCKLIKELSCMSGVFTSADADWTPEIQCESCHNSNEQQIECRVKRYGDSFVIMLVNASDAAAAIQVRTPVTCDRTLRLWGHDASIEWDRIGRFKDLLQPYDVRIYSPDRDLLDWRLFP